MMTTLILLAAYAVPSLIARKRKMGALKAAVLSVLFTPFIAVPLALRSKPKGAPVKPSAAKPPVRPSGPYGYDPTGRTIPDSVILSEEKTVKVSSAQRTAPEQRPSAVRHEERRDRSMHV